MTTRCARIAVWLIVVSMAAPAVSVGRVEAEAPQQGAAASRPNIVLIFPDNLGWGEVGAYGSVRGVPTPRLDKLASEGIRLNNFNVEYSCTVSRAALMTGRYAIRTGATQRRGDHAVGDDHPRSAEAARLRDGALSGSGTSAATGRRARASRRIRASTSTTAFHVPATKRRPPSLRVRRSRTRRSSGKARRGSRRRT